MSGISVVPLESHHLSHAEEWFDEKTSSMLLKAPALPTSNMAVDSQYVAWAGLEEGEVTAVVVVSVDPERVGWLNFAVEPAARRRGVGTEVVSKVLQEPEVKELRAVRMLIDPANTGAQKLATKLGFIKAGYGPDGTLEFERRL